MPHATDAPARPDVQTLRDISRELRADIIRMLVEAKSGHPGGSLSAIDALVCLYFGGVLRYRPAEPEWPERDRFVLSKGHCTPALYSVLARAGYFPRERLMSFRKFGSPLQGHPDRTRLPGVEASTGSLGQGLSMALGMALAARIDGSGRRVYAMLGDGEIQAGQVWEAVMSAGNFGVDNLTAIVDCNQVQQTGLVRDIQDEEPLAAKWSAFRWNVIECDGHDHAQVLDALDGARACRGRPTVILARTVKGKGVSFMELDYNWHGKAPSPEEGERALAEILAGESSPAPAALRGKGDR
ncbi:MAG: transketolase [Acidobacteria bacterium]|nr:transketolase [Acidobacteriota bacterium]